MTIYDTIGTTYTSTRQPDPRVGALIHAALGDAFDGGYRLFTVDL